MPSSQAAPQRVRSRFRAKARQFDDLYEDVAHRANLGGAPHREAEVAGYRKEVWQELQETARGNAGAYQRFSKLVRNPQVNPSEFRFDPPKGADVLGDK